MVHYGSTYEGGIFETKYLKSLTICKHTLVRLKRQYYRLCKKQYCEIKKWHAFQAPFQKSRGTGTTAPKWWDH